MILPGLAHEEGFEKEEKFWMVLGQALQDCNLLKARTVERIIAHFAPDFVEGLFDIRPCERKLRYIGSCCHEDPTFYGDSPDDFFKLGEIYESIDFNGATYAIKGYENGSGRIGSAYFERLS